MHFWTVNGGLPLSLFANLGSSARLSSSRPGPCISQQFCRSTVHIRYHAKYVLERVPMTWAGCRLIRRGNGAMASFKIRKKVPKDDFSHRISNRAKVGHH